MTKELKMGDDNYNIDYWYESRTRTLSIQLIAGVQLKYNLHYALKTNDFMNSKFIDNRYIIGKSVANYPYSDISIGNFDPAFNRETVLTLFNNMNTDLTDIFEVAGFQEICDFLSDNYTDKFHKLFTKINMYNMFSNETTVKIFTEFLYYIFEDEEMSDYVIINKNRLMIIDKFYKWVTQCIPVDWMYASKDRMHANEIFESIKITDNIPIILEKSTLVDMFEALINSTRVDGTKTECPYEMIIKAFKRLCGMEVDDNEF